MRFQVSENVGKPGKIRTFSKAEMKRFSAFVRHIKSTQSTVIHEDDFKDINTQKCFKPAVSMRSFPKSCGKLFYKMYFAVDFLIDGSMVNPPINR